MAEVCCALAALALLLMVTLPALGMSKGRSHRIVCVNNLSRIGLANAMWANEHDGRRPMMVPYWDGGTATAGTPPSGNGNGSPWFAPISSTAWFQYYWLSNELVTPKVLLCPSDATRRPATDWSASSAGGLLHAIFRNNSVSYVVAHSFSELERGLIGADRNLPFTLAIANCAYGYQGVKELGPTSQSLAWSGILHYPLGNLLYNDGTVEVADDTRLRVLFDATTPTSSRVHYLVP